jgi:uncharacterized protein YjbI with pentapeptide repeats
MRRLVLLATVLAGLLVVPFAGAAENLRGADLRGADLGGQDLRGADLRDARLDGADLRGARLDGARLTGASLRGARLGPLPSARTFPCAPNCAGANLNDGYADGWQTPVDYSNVDFSGAQMANFIGDQSIFTGANFSGASMNEASFQQANLTGANFSNANLNNGILTYANLTNTNFNGATLTGANLQWATTLGWSAGNVNWGVWFNYDLTTCTDGTAAGSSGCPAAQGESGPSCTTCPPGLIDPEFTASPSRLVPDRPFRLSLSRKWPTRQAPCATPGSGSIYLALAQGGRVYLFPPQRLGARVVGLRMPSAGDLRVAGISTSGRATITATALGCDKRPTYFGRDTVRFAATTNPTRADARQSSQFTPIPPLIDPTFAVAPNRLRPDRSFRLTLSEAWPTTRAPCTTPGSNAVTAMLAQGGRVYVFPPQALQPRRLMLQMPPAKSLRQAGIRTTGRATITATVLGCDKRATYFGRDTFRF